MIVPKIAGIETEYGAALRTGTASGQDVHEFLIRTWDDWIPWDYQHESQTADARAPSLLGVSWTSWLAGDSGDDDESRRSPERPPASAGFTIAVKRVPSTILPNGGRLYLDHAHPEYCTPECRTAREVVAYDQAGERLLMTMARRYNQERDRDNHLVLYKNNSDHQGHSYGCHENYLLAADAYVDLFNRRSHKLYAYLLPYLVSRQVFCGAGKVGAERPGTKETDFQISQRADFFEEVIGLQTTHRRPIINTRDEPHADPRRFRRLHVICGDANLAEWSTYLKVGVTQLVLAMIESDQMRLTNDLLLAHPIAAFHELSRDPSLKATVELETNARRYTALQIQRVFVEAADRYLDADEQAAGEWRDIWTDWAGVIDLLERDPQLLDRFLDWRIKYSFLGAQLERKGLAWSHPVARELDTKYHQLDQDEGLFFVLKRAGLVESIVDDAYVDSAVQRPPDSTRSYLRGLCVRQYPDQVVSCNWDHLAIRSETETDQAVSLLRLTDPTAGTRDDLDAACGPDISLQDIVAYCSHLERHPRKA